MKDLARYKGVSIEKGATWIEQRHRMLLKICRMYNITLIEQYSKGSGTYLAQDKPYSRKDLMESPLYGPTISRVLKLLDDIAE